MDDPVLHQHQHDHVNQVDTEGDLAEENERTGREDLTDPGTNAKGRVDQYPTGGDVGAREANDRRCSGQYGEGSDLREPAGVIEGKIATDPDEEIHQGKRQERTAGKGIDMPGNGNLAARKESTGRNDKEDRSHIPRPAGRSNNNLRESGT